MNISDVIFTVVSRIPWITRQDIHMKDVLHGSVSAATIKVLGMGLGFGYNILLARLLGAEGVGVYYLALSVTTIGVIIGQVGLGSVLLRFTAANVALQNWEKVAGIYRNGILMAAGTSITVSMIVFGVAPWLANTFYSEPALARPLQVMAFAIFPMSLLLLHAELLKGLRKIRPAILINSVGVPLFNIPLFILINAKLGVLGAATAYVISTGLVFFIGIKLWSHSTPQIRGVRGHFDTRVLVVTGFPLFVIAIMNLVMDQINLILLGVWTNSETVGIYGIALRTAVLTSFILFAVNSVVAPKFAALYAQENYEALATLARNIVRISSLVALFFVSPFILAPSWILGVFGSEFAEGTTILPILAIGQFINVITGPVGLLLTMTGYEKVQRNNVILSACLDIFLCLILIPSYGAAGAAIAASLSLIFKNINATFLVQRYLSINVWPIKQGRI